MKSINCQKLKELRNNQKIELIDVREPFEYQMGNLGGKNVPVSEIQNRLSEIPQDKKVVLYCRSGSRSSMVISFLEQNFNYKNLINLDGGIINC